jgi:hypothetical protein
MLSRLAADWSHHSRAKASRTAPRLACLPPSGIDALFGPRPASAAPAPLAALAELATALRRLSAEDEEFVTAAAHAALSLANGGAEPKLDGAGPEVDSTWNRPAPAPGLFGLFSSAPGHGAEPAHGTIPGGEPGEIPVGGRPLLAHRLCVAGGREPRVWLELLIQIYISSDAQNRLAVLNPFLSRAEADRVLDLTGAVLLRASRVSHARRCLPLVEELAAMVAKRADTAGGTGPAGGDTAGGPGRAGDDTAGGGRGETEQARRVARTELSVRAEGLAAALVAERAFVEAAGGAKGAGCGGDGAGGGAVGPGSDGRGGGGHGKRGGADAMGEGGQGPSKQGVAGEGGFECDPRLLAFEFVSTFLLRKPQVSVAPSLFIFFLARSSC